MSAAPARVESLDYLRGLLAVAVMVYHYLSWLFHEPDAGTLLGRLGIYAVSTFYILSGLSLALVYRDRLGGADSLKEYAINRLFRIAPLFWVVVTLSLLLQVLPSLFLENRVPDLDAWRIFLNYSLLFGFVRPDAYFSTGAWSIGNEMVFYAIFPVVILAMVRYNWSSLIALLASLIIACWFTLQIDPSRSLAAQWNTYINPFNQLPFFIAGMAIAQLGRQPHRWCGRAGLVMLGAGLLLFALVAAEGDSVALVVVPARAAFFLSCVLIVAGIYLSNPLLIRLPFGRGLSKLGAWTYSIYLLHPFVPLVTTRIFGDGWLSYVFAAAGTILLSSASYRWLELPFMRLGKQIAGKARLKRIAVERTA